MHTPGPGLGCSSQGLKGDCSSSPALCVLPAHTARSALGRSCNPVPPPGLSPLASGGRRTPRGCRPSGRHVSVLQGSPRPCHLVLRWIPRPQTTFKSSPSPCVNVFLKQDVLRPRLFQGKRGRTKLGTGTGGRRACTGTSWLPARWGHQFQDEAQHRGQQAWKALGDRSWSSAESDARTLSRSGSPGADLGGGSCRVPPQAALPACVGSAVALRATCLQTLQLCSPLQNGDRGGGSVGPGGGVRGHRRRGSRLLPGLRGPRDSTGSRPPGRQARHWVTASSQLSDRRRVLRGRAALRG